MPGLVSVTYRRAAIIIHGAGRTFRLYRESCLGEGLELEEGAPHTIVSTFGGKSHPVSTVKPAVLPDLRLNRASSPRSRQCWLKTECPFVALRR